MLGGGDRKVRYTYNTATRLSKAMRRVDDKRQKKSQRVQSYISYYNDKSKTAAHVSVWPLFFSFFSLSLWLSRGNENCRPDGHIPAINKDSTTFASAKSLLILFHYSAAFRSIWGFYAATGKSIVSYRLMSSFSLADFPALPGVTSTKPEMTGRSLFTHDRKVSLPIRFSANTQN